MVQFAKTLQMARARGGSKCFQRASAYLSQSFRVQSLCLGQQQRHFGKPEIFGKRVAEIMALNYISYSLICGS